MLSVVKLNVAMQNVIMLSIVMLNVLILSVVAPDEKLYWQLRNISGSNICKNVLG
jgi:hypothetical protein